MSSDFFYPGFGGVESHLFALSTGLLKRGHKVVILTRSQPHLGKERTGIRYMTNGLKVYYVPYKTFQTGSGPATLPTIMGIWPILRNILIRERIDILHGHQCTSNFCTEGIFHATTMGVRTCFTDHSLFGFADAAGIHINKVLKWVKNDIDQAVAVSHTSRENLVLRTHMNPINIHVVPHAVDTGVFRPLLEESTPSLLESSLNKNIDQQVLLPYTMSRDVLSEEMETLSSSSSSETNTPTVEQPKPRTLTIVSISRLVYRKGADLLVAVVPIICKQFPHVNWIIAGGGPKEGLFELMIEQHNLYQRVQLLGPVPHAKIRQVLIQGDIFINCSLTEAFCIALLEAAACGLFVVSTKVGGVPEVLPPDMIVLPEPNVPSIVEALSKAITEDVYKVDKKMFHQRIENMYNWDSVAERTEKVYDKVMEISKPSMLGRFVDYYNSGVYWGYILVLLLAFEYIIYFCLEWFYPREDVDIAVDVEDKLKK